MEPQKFLEKLNIDPKKFVSVREELGASSGSAYMLVDLLSDYHKLIKESNSLMSDGSWTAFSEQMPKKGNFIEIWWNTNVGTKDTWNNDVVWSGEEIPLFWRPCP